MKASFFTAATSAQIAQTPATVPAPNGNVLDWGIAIAILVFLGREALTMFKNKDAEEAKLTATLIEDQRQTNKELRKFLEAEQLGISRISDALSQMEQRLARHSTELLVDNRERLAKIADQMTALHKRLDRMDVKHGSDSNQPE
jgi:uncharacterized coiled-coil protein SlyX